MTDERLAAGESEAAQVPIGAIDKMHEEVTFLSDHAGRSVDDSTWWLLVGEWLDQARPLSFYRNTGELRERVTTGGGGSEIR